MSEFDKKLKNAAQRKGRSRAKIFGTAERPRLSVKISNMNVSAQIIDDNAGKTLASATSVGQKMTGNLSDKAAKVGAEVAKNAKKVKVKKVVFDRGNRIYAKRLAALAEAARKEGLEF